MSSKNLSFQELLNMVIDASIESVRTYVWDYLYNFIQQQLAYAAQPSRWVSQAFSHLQPDNVYFNPDDGCVYFHIISNGLDEYSAIKARVIDKGNQQHGKLWTQPGRLSYRDDLTDVYPHKQYCRGKPAIWVHNTKPDAKVKKIYRYKRKTGNVGQIRKQYTVKVGKFYPIFSFKELPQQFNTEGIHILNNAMKRAKYQSIVQIFDDGVVSILRTKGIDTSMITRNG